MTYVKDIILALLLIIPITLVSASQFSYSEMIEEGSEYMIYDMGGNDRVFQSKYNPEIFNGTDWVDSIVFENATLYQIESALGSFQFHKAGCNGIFYEGGNINASSVPILGSESWIFHNKNLTSGEDWQYIDNINEAACSNSLFQNDTHSIITSNKTVANHATFSTKYIKNIGEPIKLIVSVINQNVTWTNHTMGFIETIHTPDTVYINGTSYHIPSNNGTFFDHNYFMNNTQGVYFGNGLEYDTVAGIANLWGTTLLYEGGQSKITFDYSLNDVPTGVNEIFEIDPVLSSSGTREGVQESDNDTICDDTGGSYNSESTSPSSYLWDLFLTDECIRGYIRVDISSIPTTTTAVNDVTLDLDPTLFTWIGSPESTRTNDMTTDPIGRTNAQQFDEINDGVNMASFAISSAAPVTVDLGALADSRYLTHIQGARGWVSVGMFQADETLAPTDQGWYRSTSTVLNINYTVPPPAAPLTAPFDLNATAVAPDKIDLLWSHDLANVTTFDIYRNNTLIASRDNSTLGFEDANQEIFSLTLTNSLENATGLTPLTNYEYHVCATSKGDTACVATNASDTTSDDTNVWQLKEHDGDGSNTDVEGTVTDAASTFNLESDIAGFGRAHISMFKSFNATEIYGDPVAFGSDLEAFYQMQSTGITDSNTFGRFHICDEKFNRFNTTVFANELDASCESVSDFNYLLRNVRQLEDPNNTLQPRAILDWKNFNGEFFTVIFNMRDRATVVGYDMRLTNFTITNQTTYDFATVESLNYSSIKTCNLDPVITPDGNSADDCDLGVVEFAAGVPHVELKAVAGSNDWQYIAHDHDEGNESGFEEIRVESDGIHLETLNPYNPSDGEFEETEITLFKEFNVTDLKNTNMTISWFGTGSDNYENSMFVFAYDLHPFDRWNYTQFAENTAPDNFPTGDTLGSKGFATTAPDPVNPPFALRQDTFAIDTSLTTNDKAFAFLQIHDNSRVGGADFVVQWIKVGNTNYSFTGGAQSITEEVRFDRSWGDRGLITPNQTKTFIAPPFNAPINVNATTDIALAINVTWTPFNATFVDGYKVYNSTTGGEPFDLLTTTGNFTGEGFFLHSPLLACELMTYKVAAFNAGGDSPNSTAVLGNTFCEFISTFNSLVLENIGDTFRISGDFDFTGGNLTSLALSENGTQTDFNGTDVNATATSVTNIPFLFWERQAVTGARNFTVTATGQTPVYTTFTDTASDIGTREYNPLYLPAIVPTQGDVNFTHFRFDDDDQINLRVNRLNVPTGETWEIKCIYQTIQEALKTQTTVVPATPTISWLGTWIDNQTDTGYFNGTISSVSGGHIYISCFNPDELLFSTTSYTNSSLALLGIDIFDTTFGSFLGVPVGIFFVVLAAGMANKRTAPTWIIVLVGIAGVMSTLGFFTLEPVVWGLALVTAMLGLLVNQKIF